MIFINIFPISLFFMCLESIFPISSRESGVVAELEESQEILIVLGSFFDKILKNII